MRPRALVPVLTALLGSLVLLWTPADAQEAPRSVSYGGVGFSFDTSLGSSVDITDVPAAPGGPFSFPQPAHFTFTLYGQKPEFGHVPAVGVGDVVVEFYRVADMSGAPEYAQQLSKLQALLSDRPDLKPWTVAHVRPADQPLPHVPLPEDAAQVVRARASYTDRSEIHGISYITAYGQDIAGFGAHDFEATFQGVSADGTWLISVVVPLDATMFPARRPSLAFANAAAEAKYLNQTVRMLTGASADAFTPSLRPIDALVGSISFAGISPSPSPSERGSPRPSESAAPSPGESAVPTPIESIVAPATESVSP